MLVDTYIHRENMDSQGEVMRKVEASQGKWGKMQARAVVSGSA